MNEVLKFKGTNKRKIAAAALIYTNDIFQSYVQVPSERVPRKRKRRLKDKDITAKGQVSMLDGLPTNNTERSRLESRMDFTEETSREEHKESSLPAVRDDKPNKNWAYEFRRIKKKLNYLCE